MPRPVSQQFASEFEGALVECQRQFVDEALVEERGVRMPDRSPEADRHRARRHDGLQAIERKAIGRVLDGIALGLALLRQPDGSRDKLVARRLANLALAD